MAIITYRLVAIIQHDIQLKRSTYEVLQIFVMTDVFSRLYITQYVYDIITDILPMGVVKHIHISVLTIKILN